MPLRRNSTYGIKSMIPNHRKTGRGPNFYGVRNRRFYSATTARTVRPNATGCGYDAHTWEAPIRTVNGSGAMPALVRSYQRLEKAMIDHSWAVLIFRSRQQLQLPTKQVIVRSGVSPQVASWSWWIRIPFYRRRPQMSVAYGNGSDQPTLFLTNDSGADTPLMASPSMESAWRPYDSAEFLERQASHVMWNVGSTPCFP